MTALTKLTNEGQIDRVIRVVVGAVVLSLAFVGPETAWGLLGLIPLATGALGICPIYTMLGINTCQKGDCPDAA